MASPLGKALGTPTDRAGRVQVAPDLSVPGHPNVFVAGDLMQCLQDGKPVPGVAPAAMNARKLAKGWELVLHPGKRFSTAIGADAHVLATTLVEDAPLFEHLCIDVQPAGDKTHTTLHLEVRFDRLLARTRIEIPQ